METINYIGKYDSLELLWKAYPGGGIEGDYALIGEVYYGWDKYKSQWVETTLSEQINNSSEPSVETKDAVNYLGAFDSWADVWRLFPEGGHPGDYLALGGTNYIWNTSILNWDILSSDANVIEGETPSGTSPGELNYLGHFLSMSDVWYFFPEGGQPGDFVQVSDIFYVWDTISQNWQNSKTTIYVNYDFAGRAIEASKTRTTINYLGSFAELNDVWIVYPEGGHEGDYIHLAEEIQVWNKYRNNWGDYETPQTPAIKTDVVDGTLKVVQDLIVGGKLIAKDIDIDINQLKLFTLKFLLQNGDITYNPKLADKTVDLRNFASNEDLTKLKVELSKAIEDLDIDTLKSILSLFTPIYDDAKKLKQIQPNAPLGVDEISSKTFAPGIFGSGFQLSQRADGTSLLTVDSAIIRRSLTVFELIIQQLKHQGGIVFYTAASMEVSAVERVTGGWKCYFDTKNGQVPNQFVVNDQARCQRFNIGTTSSKYYWRLVTAVGPDYIVLSDTDCDEGSDIPEVADTIVQLGNRSNVDNSRKAAIVISSYGDNSPSIMMYTGIDSYSLKDKEIHGTIYRNNNGEYEAYFYNYGSMRLGAKEGEDGGYITYDHKTKQLNINAVVNFLPQSTGLEQMEAYQKLVQIAQGNIETWFYDGVSPIQSGAPTMSNYPVNTWEADDYENHIGDIYYSNTGKGYRFKRSGSTWEWEIISDTELAQLMADVQSLQYLKTALSDGTTTVAGGLILTSLIQLGYEDAENVRHTMAGISGLGQNSTAPAAWFGGPMVDHELNPDATEFAKSLFRFNGTGYLASGNITWDEKGYGQVGGEGDNYALKWDEKEVRIGPNIKLGAGDETIAMLANLLNMFELDTTSVAGKTLIHAKYDGLYSDGDIAAGGAWAGTPSGGGKTYLNELLDVQLVTSSLNVGDMLMWNGVKYVNIPQSSITPDLSTYATQQWVLDKKYLTSVPVASVVGQTGNITTAQVATALTDAGYKLTDTTYGLATTTSNGLMSATDKTKLDGIDANANNYTLPTASSSTKGGIKVGTTLSISGEVLDLKSGFPKGTYTKVQIDDYGRVSSGSTLSASDIPSLPWSKITTGKPTTISGYGITDAYTKTETDNKVAALQSLLDSMFERVYDSNNKLIRVHSNVTISSSGDLVAGSNSEGGGTSGGAYTQLEWNAIKALTQSESGLLASAYSVKEAYNELNTAIEALAGKATNVKFTQTLTSGKQIGSISIDGKSTSLYAPGTYAWSEVTNKPTFATVATSGSYTDLTNKPTIASLMGSTAIGGTSSYIYWNGSAWATKALGSNAFTSISKVSQLTNDSGYITGITKAMVEGVLTGNITSHTHSYLSLAGGTMSNTNIVTNLNADLLDGYNASSFAKVASANNLIYAGNEFNFVPSAYAGEIHINYRTITGTDGAITKYNFDNGAGGVLASISQGQFSGNAATATKATQDGNGKVIADTYLPLSGGMIRGTQTGPFNINTTATEEVGMRFYMSDSPKAWVGYAPNIGANLFVYSNHKLGLSDAGVGFLDSNTLLHSGNIGSYALKTDGSNAMEVGILWRDYLGFDETSMGLRTFMSSNGTSVDGIFPSTNYGTVLHVSVNSSLYAFQLASPVNADGLFYRGYYANKKSWEPWKAIAFTDSNITGNASSATQLQTPRTIWGQSFNGTGNVSGSLTGVTSINLSANANGNISFTDDKSRKWYLQYYTDTMALGYGYNSSIKVDVNGNFSAPGDVTAGSDIRYKDKIQDLRLSVHDIALAPAFTYKWNNREDALVHIGSSAQYWLNTDAKDAVYYDKQNDFYHLNYASLALCNTIILARGMETQEEKIARLEARINELEDKLRQYDSCR